MSQFLIDIAKIRTSANSMFQQGALTESNETNTRAVIELLEGALATEWICVLRYTQHALTAKGIHSKAVAEEFTEHAAEELEHAKWLASRINQLGGVPSLDPATLARKSHSQYKECKSITEMIRENLIAERIAIISYREMIRYVGDGDPTTRRMLEDILKVEEEHAEDLSSLLLLSDL